MDRTSKIEGVYALFADCFARRKRTGLSEATDRWGPHIPPILTRSLKHCGIQHVLVPLNEEHNPASFPGGYGRNLATRPPSSPLRASYADAVAGGITASEN